MKKVLFITYYWPPSGKASLHWPLKIMKHLPKYGWQPSVLTVEEDTFSQQDETLSEDISPELKIAPSVPELAAAPTVVVVLPNILKSLPL